MQDNVGEEDENSISRQFIEWVINRLELVAKFNVLPFVNEREEEMAEVAINLRILFHSWCRKLKERSFMEVQGSLVGYSSSQTFNK